MINEGYDSALAASLLFFKDLWLSKSLFNLTGAPLIAYGIVFFL